jgi:hypothetical protein
MKLGFFPGCYFYYKNQQVFFYGIIASKKVIHSKAILYIGVASQQYVTIRIDKWYSKSKTVAVRGYGTGTKYTIDCIHYQLL